MDKINSIICLKSGNFIQHKIKNHRLKNLAGDFFIPLNELRK